ncbi:MAG: PAS domain S-box protein [Synechococcaceae cyanobacterium ELA739]
MCIIIANPDLCRLLEQDSQELIGQVLWEIDAFEDRLRAHNLFLELKAQGTVRYDDLRLISASGQRKHVEFVSNVYLVGEERVIPFNIRNISDRKAVERLAAERQAQVLQGLEDTVAALVSRSEARDPYTAGQQSRVADLAFAVAAAASPPGPWAELAPRTGPTVWRATLGGFSP